MDNVRLILALHHIRKGVDRLGLAVERGVYDSRSTVADEVLRMREELEGVAELLPPRVPVEPVIEADRWPKGEEAARGY